MTTINYSIRSLSQPWLTTSDVRVAAQPSLNEVKFDEAVKALLSENHKHRDLKLRLRQLVVDEAQKLPLINVLYCTSFGGFHLSKEFEAFLDSRSISEWNRSDPALIQAVSDFGRIICDKFPFILDEMRVVYTWKLDQLLAKLRKEFYREETVEFNPDLIAEAKSFLKQMCDTDGGWSSNCLGTFPNGRRVYSNDTPEISFMAFMELHPEFWMSHYSVQSYSFCSATFQISFRFAHALLQGSERARYQVLPDEAQDAAVYERVGLFGATSSCLAIKEIPALLDYTITEYDGQESVNCGPW